MRVTTAFNKILGLSGASVVSVAFTPDGIVVGLRRRCRRLVCPCGFSTRSTYDRSRRRWRHLDLGATRLYLEAEIRRLSCRRCGRVRTEEVAWARPGARHTPAHRQTAAHGNFVPMSENPAIRQQPNGDVDIAVPDEKADDVAQDPTADAAPEASAHCPCG